MTSRRLIPLIIVLVATQWTSLAGPAHAADHSFGVNTMSDTVDANIGDGKCKDAGSYCSLRAAVQEANRLGGVTNITLVNPGTYTLTITGAGEDDAATGDIDIRSSINLYAPSGSGNATVNANPSFGDRIFDIPAGTLSMSVVFEPRLIISGGAAPVGQDGGGIRALNAGFVYLNQMTVSGNSARNGGGAYVTGPAGSTFQTNLPVITGNTATGNGGGLDIEGAEFASLTRLTVQNNHAGTGGGLAAFVGRGATGSSTTTGQGEINNNTATVAGGGLAVSRFSASILDITGNSALNGGGVYLLGQNGPSAISGRIYILDNTASAKGGGVYGDCATSCGELAQITIENNSAGSDGGGMYLSGGLTYHEGLLHANTAGGTNGGAGLVHTGALPLALTNVTVSGNNSTATGGLTSGGVVDKATVADSFFNDTISWNTGGSRNGVVVTGTGAKAPEVKNTIVSDPTTGTTLCNKVLSSLGHNIDSGNSCGFAATGDQPNTDPKLNPVTDNGGGMYTMSLKPGTPWVAIDSGDDNGCPSTDARWVRRPQDGGAFQGTACDIGAYEVSSTFQDVQVGLTLTPDVTKPHPGDLVTYTVTLTNGGPFNTLNSWVIGTFPSQLTLTFCGTSNGILCTIRGHTATVIFPSLGLSGLPTMTVIAQVGSSVPVGTVLTSAAVTWSDNPDDNHSNNAGSASVTVS